MLRESAGADELNGRGNAYEFAGGKSLQMFDGRIVSPFLFIELYKKALGFIKQKSDYVADLIGSCPIYFVTSTDITSTMAVDFAGNIYMNPHFMYKECKCRADLIGTILFHEAYHVLYNHVKRGISYYDRYGGNFNGKLLNAAADYEVNAALIKNLVTTRDVIQGEMHGFYEQAFASKSFEQIMDVLRNRGIPSLQDPMEKGGGQSLDQKSEAQKAQESADRAKQAADNADKAANDAMKRGDADANQKRQAADEARQHANNAQDAANDARNAESKARKATSDSERSQAESEAKSAAQRAESEAKQAEAANQKAGGKSVDQKGRQGNNKNNQSPTERAKQAADRAQQSADNAQKAADEAKANGDPSASEKQKLADEAQQRADEAKQAAQEAAQAEQDAKNAGQSGDASSQQSSMDRANQAADRAEKAAQQAEGANRQAGGQEVKQPSDDEKGQDGDEGYPGGSTKPGEGKGKSGAGTDGGYPGGTETETDGGYPGGTETETDGGYPGGSTTGKGKGKSGTGTDDNGNGGDDRGGDGNGDYVPYEPQKWDGKAVGSIIDPKEIKGKLGEALKETGMDEEDVADVIGRMETDPITDPNSPIAIKQQEAQEKAKKKGDVVGKALERIEISGKVVMNLWRKVIEKFIKGKALHTGVPIDFDVENIRLGRKSTIAQDGPLDYYVPRKGEKPQLVHVLVDVSGSIDTDLTKYFLNFIKQLAKKEEYSGMTIVPFSDYIHYDAITKFGLHIKESDYEKAVAEVFRVAGGGTQAFRGMAKYMNDVRKKEDGSVFLVLTDGEIYGDGVEELRNNKADSIVWAVYTYLETAEDVINYSYYDWLINYKPFFKNTVFINQRTYDKN